MNRILFRMTLDGNMVERHIRWMARVLMLEFNNLQITQEARENHYGRDSRLCDLSEVSGFTSVSLSDSSVTFCSNVGLSLFTLEPIFFDIIFTFSSPQCGIHPTSSWRQKMEHLSIRYLWTGWQKLHIWLRFSFLSYPFISQWQRFFHSQWFLTGLWPLKRSNHWYEHQFLKFAAWTFFTPWHVFTTDATTPKNNA